MSMLSSRFWRHQSSLLLLLVLCWRPTPASAFVATSRTASFCIRPDRRGVITNAPRVASDGPENKKDDKFSFGQRIESIKCVVVGALSGGISLTPVALLHDTLFSQGLVPNGLAQWEFDTDMGSLEAALFAIVYRYCIRTDENPMLNQGVLGAFVLVRTLSRIQVPSYCTFAPLSCGAPLEYFNWSMIFQGIWSGAESVALFGGATLAMDYCFRKSFISKFP